MHIFFNAFSLLNSVSCRTPLHSDVFSSFSWSTNIAGCKKWLFLIPGEEKKLFDNFGNIPFSIDEAILNEAGVRYATVIQNTGETVFVPSGWYHQVWNLEHTISVNHNWFNGCNVQLIWNSLYENYLKVLKEIDDCKDMDQFEEHCQIMLRASHGLNFEQFLKMLEVVANNRFESNTKSINGFQFGENLVRFDLLKISSVLDDLMDKCTGHDVLLDRCKILKSSIDNYL